MDKVQLLQAPAMLHNSNALMQPKSTDQVCFEFAAEIAASGLQAPTSIEADGAIHRFNSSGKRKGKAGWYVLHMDGVPAGVFGSWDIGLVVTWVSQPYTRLNEQQRNLLSYRLQQVKEQRQAMQAQRHKSVQTTAQWRWEHAEAVTAHPYLAAKCIPSYRLRTDGAALLVPMRDISGNLHSLQTIDANGNKLFMAGGRVRGCYYSVGEPNGVVVVTEGMATAHSIHEATKLPVAAAFSAGNLLPVAQALKAKFPYKTLIVAADDDHTTPGNPGLTAAHATALAVGGYVAVPQFTASRPRMATDFNDLAQLEGVQTVATCFKEVLEGLHYE